MPAVLSDNSISILKKRYLQEGESVPDLWKRVSGGNREYEELMADLLFLPNSPTLFNMGTKSGGTLSACFVFDVTDSLRDGNDSIIGTEDKAASVAKAGGGVGYYFGNLRRKGSYVNSTHRKACGPVAVLKRYHTLRALITQGGKRDLAQMGVLPCWHPDIHEFVHVKDEDPKALESFNISVSWTDEWMNAVDFKTGGLLEMSPATKLWWEQCDSAWKSGDPGMLFYDTINKTNATPHLGNINATNPCGETPNISDEPCNLGSIVLRRMLKTVGKKWEVDWDKLRNTVKASTRFLDDILDWNKFPHADIDRMARSTRKLGLGVMGWADMLALLRIPYDTQDAVDLGSEVMRVIAEESLAESMRLALTKGVYPAYDKDKSPEWAPAARNSTRTSIAPTGTISIIAECEPSIEPHFALERQRTTNEGMKFTERIDKWLGDLSGFVPKTSNEIGLEWHIKHQAAFQKYTDLGVSKTINMPNSATIEDISRAYHLMWKTGCKGGTVYRDGCRSEQVLVATKKSSVYSTAVDLPPGEMTEGILRFKSPPARKLLPDEVTTKRYKFRVGGVKGYVHVGHYDDGTPGEVFIRGSKFGSTLGGMLDAWCMNLSLALQHQTPLTTLVKLHTGSRFDPAGLTSNPQIPIATSIPDYIVRLLELKYLKPTGGGDDGKVGNHDDGYEKAVVAKPSAPRPTARPAITSGQACPDCGSQLISHGGCSSCTTGGCGFSKCG